MTQWKFATAVFFILLVATARAWNAAGHMVIAAIARAELTPTAKAEADRLLRIGVDIPGSDDFITVGPWADDYRSKHRETGPWHFKDLYFRADGKTARNKPDEINAVYKIREFTAVLADKNRSDADRAFALRFLIHLVGDIHQPLHASSRESDAYPGGDRGGNSFAILPPDGSELGPKNLHSLWDSGAGLFPSRPREVGKAAAETQAKELIASISRSFLLKIGETNPDKWTEEGLSLAKSVVYSTREGIAPDSVYIEKAQKVAALRAVLAGYRLANLLNRALDEGSGIPDPPSRDPIRIAVPDVLDVSAYDQLRKQVSVYHDSNDITAVMEASSFIDRFTEGWAVDTNRLALYAGGMSESKELLWDEAMSSLGSDDAHFYARRKSDLPIFPLDPLAASQMLKEKGSSDSLSFIYCMSELQVALRVSQPRRDVIESLVDYFIYSHGPIGTQGLWASQTSEGVIGDPHEKIFDVKVRLFDSPESKQVEVKGATFYSAVYRNGNFVPLEHPTTVGAGTRWKQDIFWARYSLKGKTSGIKKFFVSADSSGPVDFYVHGDGASG